MKQRDNPPAMVIIAKTLERLDEKVDRVEADGKVTRAKVEMLNDWHNRVSGALAVLTALGLAIFGVVAKLLFDR